jgi:hypothetical protein
LTRSLFKKAYRNLAKENHPDKGGDEEKFKKINEAYDTIGDENKRQQYDNQKNNPFGGNFEWIISPDISGFRMWHRRGGNYAFINFSERGQTYNLNQWHFAVIRFNYPVMAIDWYNNSGTRVTTETTNFGSYSGGVLQVPLRFNNYLHGRVGYYAVNNSDIGAGGSDIMFNALRGRYGR